MTGLRRVSTEAQRLAVAVADRTGAAIDWTDSPADAAVLLALQAVGVSGATYGEIAERADLIVYWRCPPAPLPGFDRIGGASRRRLLQVGDGPWALGAGTDYEALCVLRALAAGLRLDDAAVHQQTGVPLPEWVTLLGEIASADYAALVRGRAVGEAGPAAVAAMTRLAQQLHDRTRVVVATPPADDNAAGAENVMAWQTGYPMAVDFSRGYPRYLPGEASGWAVRARDEWDVALEIDPHKPMMTIRQRGAKENAEETAGLAIAPLASGGTRYRTDGVATPIRRTGDGPTAAGALRALLEELDEQPAT